MIGSFGMALRYSFGLTEAADMIDKAIANVLAKGLRTADIKGDATSTVSTTQMGEAIVSELQALAK
jgi:3-isopropylmalate dehydrogenase